MPAKQKTPCHLSCADTQTHKALLVPCLLNVIRQHKAVGPELPYNVLSALLHSVLSCTQHVETENITFLKIPRFNPSAKFPAILSIYDSNIYTLLSFKGKSCLFLYILNAFLSLQDKDDDLVNLHSQVLELCMQQTCMQKHACMHGFFTLQVLIVIAMTLSASLHPCPTS